MHTFRSITLLSLRQVGPLPAENLRSQFLSNRLLFFVLCHVPQVGFVVPRVSVYLAVRSCLVLLPVCLTVSLVWLFIFFFLFGHSAATLIEQNRDNVGLLIN